MDLWARVPSPWRVALTPVRDQLTRISVQLQGFAEQGDVIVPEPDRIFAALAMSPDAVRVILIGQDPYPEPRHAMGLSFSVPKGTAPLPPSMKNIIAEIESECGTCEVPDGDLSSWVDQGVLLLNRALTTCAGRSGAHALIGWREVTDRIVKVVVESNPDVIGLLWGNSAQELRSLFRKDCVVSTSHPSPLSAYRGFVGSRCFIETNEKLVQRGHLPIQW